MRNININLYCSFKTIFPSSIHWKGLDAINKRKIGMDIPTLWQFLNTTKGMRSPLDKWLLPGLRQEMYKPELWRLNGPCQDNWASNRIRDFAALKLINYVKSMGLIWYEKQNKNSVLIAHQLITPKHDNYRERLKHLSCRIVFQANKIVDKGNFFFMHLQVINVEEIIEF